MGKATMIRARGDRDLHDKVEHLFERLGFSATQAITLFYQQVRLNRGLPSELRMRNTFARRTFAETDASLNIVRREDAPVAFARLGI